MRQPQLKFFGQEIQRLFTGSEARGLAFRPLPESSFAATHVVQCGTSAELLRPVPRENSYLMEIHLQAADSSDWGRWMGGVFERAPGYEAGAVEFYDLELEPRFLRNSPFDSLLLNVPKTTLEMYLEDSGMAAVRSFRASSGAGDRVMLHLARLMASCVDDQIRPSRVFLEHFLEMVCGHVVSEYGSLAETPRIAKGGLAPWQKRRALEILEADLGGDLRLARLSAECGLSSSYFCRCFRMTFGCSVHQFVVQRRIARAQQLLLEQELSLAEIAIGTGFSDQAAFSRTFASTIGKPPGRWRTEQKILKRLSHAGTVSVIGEHVLAADVSAPLAHIAGGSLQLELSQRAAG